MQARMIDIYSGFAVKGGIFSFMTTVQWLKLVESPVFVDKIYFHKHGMRVPSYAVEQYAEFGLLDKKTRQFLSEMLEFEFKQKWDKLFDTLYFEYDPIKNYDMREEEDSAGNNHSETTGKNIGDNTVDTKRDGGYNINRRGEDVTEVNEDKKLIGKGHDKDSVAGWNVSEFSDTSKRDTDQDTTELNKINTTNTPNLTDEQTDHDYTIIKEDLKNNFDNQTDGNHDSHRVLTRAGNIGTMTTQNMIEQERRLWLWNYFDIVFADVNKVLTLSVY